MRPAVWQPPVDLSPTEHTIVARIRQAKLFVFLCRSRHELFPKAFQAELAPIFRDSPTGQPPVPPAQLALVTILQAYTGASADEAIEALTLARRWQLALDCLDSEAHPSAIDKLTSVDAAPMPPAPPPQSDDPPEDLCCFRVFDFSPNSMARSRLRLNLASCKANSSQK